MNLVQVAEEIQHRIIHIFGRDMEGKRSTNGGNPKLDHDPHFRDYVWFYEVRHQFARSLHCNADARDSSFTRTTEGAWELPIKPAGMIGSLQTHNYMLNRFVGLVWSHTTFSRAVLPAGWLARRRGSQVPHTLGDTLTHHHSSASQCRSPLLRRE